MLVPSTGCNSGAMGEELLVDAGRSLRQRSGCVHHRRQLVVFDVDELRGGLGGLRVLGDDDGDDVALMAHLVERDQRSVGG